MEVLSVKGYTGFTQQHGSIVQALQSKPIVQIQQREPEFRIINQFFRQDFSVTSELEIQIFVREVLPSGYLKSYFAAFMKRKRNSYSLQAIALLIKQVMQSCHTLAF